MSVQRRDEKDEKLRESVDMKTMAETRPKLATVKNDATGEEEQVLVGTFLPNLEMTKSFKPSNSSAQGDQSKPFWERLHVEKD